MIRHRFERPDPAQRRLCSFGVTEGLLAAGVAEAAGAGIAADVAAGAIAPELAAMAGETALSAGIADAAAVGAGTAIPALGGAAVGALPASFMEVAQGLGNVLSVGQGTEKLIQGDPTGLLNFVGPGLNVAGINPLDMAGKAIDEAGNYVGKAFDFNGSTIMPGADMTGYSFTPGQLAEAQFSPMQIGEFNGYPAWLGPNGGFDIAGGNIQQVYDPATKAILSGADPSVVDSIERALPNIQRFNTQGFEVTGGFDDSTGTSPVTHYVGNAFDNPYYDPNFQGPLAALLAQSQESANFVMPPVDGAPGANVPDTLPTGGPNAPTPPVDGGPTPPTAPVTPGPAMPNPADTPIVPGGMTPNQIAGATDGGGGLNGGTGGAATGTGVARASFGGVDQLVSGSGIDTIAGSSGQGPGGVGGDSLVTPSTTLGTNISTGATPMVTTNVPDPAIKGFSAASGAGSGDIVDAFGQDTGIKFPSDYKGFTATADGSGGLVSTTNSGPAATGGLIERTLGSDAYGVIKDVGGLGKDVLPFASAGLLLNSLLNGGAPVVPAGSLAKNFPDTAAPVLKNAGNLADLSNNVVSTVPQQIQQNAADLAKLGSGLTGAATQPLTDAGKRLTDSATNLQAPLNSALTGDKLTLPPGAEAAVQQGVQAAKAAIRTKYAKMGMSGSTAEVQELNAVDTNAQTQRFDVATKMNTQGLSEQQIANQVYQNLLQTGTTATLTANQQYQQLLQQALQAGQISGADYKALLQTQIGQDQALQNAINSFVSGLSGATKKAA